MSDQPRCETCRWFGNDGACGSDGESHCHRYPPTVVVQGNGFTRPKWPFVRQTDFCGEHQPKEQRDE